MHTSRLDRLKSTYTWRSAKIQQDLTLLEEAILLVKLDKLESGTSTISYIAVLACLLLRSSHVLQL